MFLLEGKESDRTSIVHCIQKIVFALLIFIVTLVFEMCGENFNFDIVIFCTHKHYLWSIVPLSKLTFLTRKFNLYIMKSEYIQDKINRFKTCVICLLLNFL